MVKAAAAFGLTVPGASTFSRAAQAEGGDPETLVVGTAASASDIDPHSAYDGRSNMIIYGIYEQLMRLEDNTT
ncbi:MAG: hypothetical protein ACR2J8_15385, partial [Thermomicrobiales bacterium]